MVTLMEIYTLLGFMAHFYRDHITGHMRRDWQDISNKVLGILYIFPLSFLMFRHLRHDIPKCELRFIVSYFLSFMSFGLGVIAGFWYYPTRE